MNIDVACVWVGVFAIAFGISRRIDRLVDRQRKTEDDVRRLSKLIGLLKDKETADET